MVVSERNNVQLQDRLQKLLIIMSNYPSVSQFVCSLTEYWWSKTQCLYFVHLSWAKLLFLKMTHLKGKINLSKSLNDSNNNITKSLFQCTWRGCELSNNLIQVIEFKMRFSNIFITFRPHINLLALQWERRSLWVVKA